MKTSVAPYAGAWIETHQGPWYFYYTLSHPTRVRGLKQQIARCMLDPGRRTLRGCVD